VEEEEVNLEAFNVPLREWIAEDRTRREIKRRFKKFLQEFKVGSRDSFMLDPW
jgi:DNA replication licensing factor MCM2